MLTAERLFRPVLIAVFTVVTVGLAIPPLLVGLPFGWDAVVYTEAARAWLEGANPWTSQGYAIGYAAPPPSFLPYVPFAPLPDPVVSAAWIAIALGCAVYCLRRLELPAWWLLFPPVSLGIMTGSSALLVTALLVRAGVIAEGLAVLVRIYAALPLVLLGHWRSLLVAGGLLLLSLALPWSLFLEQRDRVEALFGQVSNLSAVAFPWLSPFAILGLVLLGRQRAAWLIVPALWPSTQLYYAVIALPVISAAPFVALAIAIPVPGLIVVGMLAQAFWERLVLPILERQKGAGVSDLIDPA